MNINNIMNDIIKYSVASGIEITLEEIQEKYNNIVKDFGEDKAIEASQNTLKQIKIKAKEIDTSFWNNVKNEVFKNFGCTPVAIRDLKNMIKDGSINITGFSNELEIRSKLC